MFMKELTELESPIKITESAAIKLKEFIAAENKKLEGLRITVSAGGCSGFVYDLALEEKVKADDEVVEQHGVKVIVEKNTLELLRGSKIDYVDSLQGAGFKIENPNFTKTCDCGNSFG